MQKTCNHPIFCHALYAYITISYESHKCKILKWRFVNCLINEIYFYYMFR